MLLTQLATDVAAVYVDGEPTTDVSGFAVKAPPASLL